MLDAMTSDRRALADALKHHFGYEGFRPLHGRWATANIGANYAAAARSGAVAAIADVTLDPLTAGSRFSEIGTRALIGVPIMRDGR